jgi:uncharacterized membrane protein
MLARLLVGAALSWPIIAGAALWQRATAPIEPVWASVVYTAASRICHQRPERSFHSHGTAWPVCARCAGLYLAAPFAAFLAFRRRGSYAPRWTPLRVAVLASIPTALTLVWEWGGLGTPPNLVRFMSALPLGAAVAFILVATVTERPALQVDRIN